MTGLTNYLAGQNAEDQIAQDYARRGRPIVARRWRGRGGEIDLIAQEGEGLVFIEVKKSSSFARAASNLSTSQMRRIEATATEFLAGQPKGQLTDIRFDLALVDKTGCFEILENAFLN